MLRSLARSLGSLAWERPRTVLLLWGLLVLAGTLALPFTLVDPTLEGLLGHDAPENRATVRLKELFGTDETIVVAIETEDALDPAVLQRLAALHADLEQVPHLEWVRSLIDAPLTWTEGDRIRVGGALKPWPSEEALAERLALLESSVYEGLHIDADHTLLVMLLTLPPPADGQLVTPPDVAREAMDGTRAVLAEHAHPSWKLYASGKVGIADALGRTLGPDLVRYGLAAGVISVLLLWWRFRRWAGVVLPVLVTLLPVVGTLGAMAALGVPLQLPSAVLPPLVVVISVAGVIHVLSDLDRRLHDVPWSREAMLATLEDKAEALTVAAATTGVGMLSLAFSAIGPAAVVGRFGTLAALLGLLSTLLVVPAWCRLFPWQAPARSNPLGAPVLRACSSLARRHSTAIVALTTLVLVISLGIASQQRFAHDPIRWMPASWDVRQGAALLDEKMQVVMDLDVVIDTGVRDGALDPAWIAKLRALQEGVMDVHEGPVHSLVHHLDDLRATLGSDLDYLDGETGRRGLARDLRLLRLLADVPIATQVTRDGRYLRLMVRTAAGDAADYLPVLQRVEEAAAREVGADHTFVGGLLPVFSATLVALRSSAAVAWPLALLGGGLLLAVIARSGRLGLLLLLPNLLPATVAIALLGLFGLPLDLFTLLTISLALGVVVDDCIHLVTGFRQQLDATGDPDQACEDALIAAGPPMVLTTVLLVAGWSTLLLSPLPGIWMFALVSSGTLALGLVADLVVTPAVVHLWARQGSRSNPSTSTTVATSRQTSPVTR